MVLYIPVNIHPLISNRYVLGWCPNEDVAETNEETKLLLIPARSWYHSMWLIGISVLTNPIC